MKRREWDSLGHGARGWLNLLCLTKERESGETERKWTRRRENTSRSASSLCTWLKDFEELDYLMLTLSCLHLFMQILLSFQPFIKISPWHKWLYVFVCMCTHLCMLIKVQVWVLSKDQPNVKKSKSWEIIAPKSKCLGHRFPTDHGKIEWTPSGCQGAARLEVWPRNTAKCLTQHLSACWIELLC